MPHRIISSIPSLTSLLICVIILAFVASLFTSPMLWVMVQLSLWIGDREKRAKLTATRKAVDSVVFRHDGGPIRMEDGALEEAPGWYFWTEDFASYRGPFPTENATRIAVDRYCEDELNCMPLTGKAA